MWPSRPPAGTSPMTAWSFRCEADDAGGIGILAEGFGFQALSHTASVSPAAAFRQMQQGPGPGLGAQSLLLPGDDPDQGCEPDCALPGFCAAAGMALAACRS